MKTAITITIRMKSSRLPLKVLRLINNICMVDQLILRLKTSQLADMVILCTSTNPQDEILVDYAKRMGIQWFRGSEDDVLKRLYDAARHFSVDFIVSTTADNPLTDAYYMDRIIEKFRETDADFITVPDLPLGCFSYGLKVNAIQTVLDGKKEEDTEIWGSYFRNDPSFKKETVNVDKIFHNKKYRLTVDYPEDLELMREIYRRLQVGENVFPIPEVVKLLEKEPQLLELNKDMHQIPYK